MDSTSPMHMYVKLDRDANGFFSAEIRDYEYRFLWVSEDVG